MILCNGEFRSWHYCVFCYIMLLLPFGYCDYSVFPKDDSRQADADHIVHVVI